MRVEEGEVTDNHGHRKCDGQDPSQCTDRPDEHSQISFGGHIPVPYRRHGDNGPPEPDRDGCEVVFWVELGPLGVEDERGEDDDEENEEEDEERELVCAGLERVDEDLETGRVSGEFEEPHDADDAEEFENLVLLLQEGHQKVEIEGQNGDEIDDVDRSADEYELVVTDHESDDQFEREPGVADAFDVEESSVWFTLSLLDLPGDWQCNSQVPADEMIEIARQRTAEVDR